jgi:hypothetical protein
VTLAQSYCCGSEGRAEPLPRLPCGIGPTVQPLDLIERDTMPGSAQARCKDGLTLALISVMITVYTDVPSQETAEPQFDATRALAAAIAAVSEMRQFSTRCLSRPGTGDHKKWGARRAVTLPNAMLHSPPLLGVENLKVGGGGHGSNHPSG